MIHFAFCRTLNSQSSASVTMANYAALLQERNISVCMTLIDRTKSFILQLERLEGGKDLLCKINSEDYRIFFPVLRNMKINGRWSNIILCGPFASLHYKEIMEQEQWVDGIILGYGEQAVIDQCSCLDRGENIDPRIEGVWRIAESRYVVNMPKTIFPLELLPTPIRDIEASDTSSICNLEFSRGCNNRCFYCHMRAYHDLFGVTRSKKTVDQVMADIENLYKMGKRYFIFNDSVFWNGNEDTEEIKDLCDRIGASGMKFYFMVYLSLYHFPDESLLQQMYSAGLIRIFVGVESPDPDVLRKIKEKEYPVNLFEKYRLIMEQMHISYHIGFIVFFPFSDMEQVKESIEYLHHIGKMHRVGILLERIRLIPGTPMCRYLETTGFNSNEIDTAYHYMIREHVCEKLQRQLMDVFTYRLQNSYIQMELLCCNLDLLVAITAHEHGDISPFERQVIAHKQLVQDYGNLIYRFVTDAIEKVKAGDDIQAGRTFVQQYTALGKALTNSWSELHRAFEHCTDADTKDIFPFCQEWMDNNGEKWEGLYAAAFSL